MCKKYFKIIFFSFLISFFFASPSHTRASQPVTVTAFQSIAGVSSVWASFMDKLSTLLVPFFATETTTPEPTFKPSSTYVRPTINTDTSPTSPTPPPPPTNTYIRPTTNTTTNTPLTPPTNPTVRTVIERLVTTSGLTTAQLDTALANLRAEMLAQDNNLRGIIRGQTDVVYRSIDNSITNIITGTDLLPLDNTFTGANTFTGNVTITGLCVTGDTRLRRRKKKADGEEADEWEDVLLTDLLEGDEVASLNTATGEIVYKKVISIIETGVREILQITLADDKSISTTDEHPYLLKGETIHTKDATWTKAKDLKVGDMIATPSTSGITWTSISSIEKKAEEQVYDLQIEDTHNFIGNDIVAHNTLTADTINATTLTGAGSGITALNASNLASGTVGTARLGSGTADNTTYLRGDGTWATVSAGLSASDLNDLDPIEVGYANDASAASSTAFGICNTASGCFSSASGYKNTAATLNSSLFGRSNFTSTGGFGSVGIGLLNNATGATLTNETGDITGTPVATSTVGYSTTALGICNLTAGNFGTAVGYKNKSSCTSSSAFGFSNNSCGLCSSALGSVNDSFGNYSSAVGFGNTTSGYIGSAVGSYNVASNCRSSAFGHFNTASGIRSSAFGHFNTTSNTCSSAFGNNLTNATACSAMIGSSAGWIRIQSDGCLTSSTGAHLTTGGAWTNNSSRDLKENFTDVNSDDVLSKINSLNIGQWNYKAEDPSITHIGPIAEDFYAAFQLGGSDKSISTIDPAGVALVGIQALSKRLDAIEASSTPTLFSTLSLDLVSSTPAELSSWNDIFGALKYFGAEIVDGVAYLKNVFVERLTVGSPKTPTGINIFDTKGQPGCLIIEDVNLGTIKVTPGSCGTEIVDSTSGSVTTTTNTSTIVSDEITSTENASSTDPIDAAIGAESNTEIIAPDTSAPDALPSEPALAPDPEPTQSESSDPALE